jgi:hypothetical protein
VIEVEGNNLAFVGGRESPEPSKEL